MKTEVSQVVWRWREAAEGEALPIARLRKKAMVQFCLTAALASVLLFGTRFAKAGVVLYAVSGVLLAAGWLAPGVFRVIDGWALKAGRAVGTLLTWILLVPFFYLCFLPARILLFLSGKDPMNRSRLPGAPTYWTAKTETGAEARFTKQY